LSEVKDKLAKTKVSLENIAASSSSSGSQMESDQAIALITKFSSMLQDQGNYCFEIILYFSPIP
jgi:hypothetical protein